jgi:hypothetical protein
MKITDVDTFVDRRKYPDATSVLHCLVFSRIAACAPRTTLVPRTVHFMGGVRQDMESSHRLDCHMTA